MSTNIVLADCVVDELVNFLKGIREAGIDVDCHSAISNEGREKRFSNLIRYSKYFMVPLSIFKRRKKYDYIIGWQQFYALIFCFWCQLFHVKKVNKVIAMNFTYKEKKGFVGIVYKWFMKKCVCNKYIDYLHVLSNDYADVLTKIFDIERARFIVTPFGVDDMMEKYGKCQAPKEVAGVNYALAIGRSNRDYDFLVDVWEKVDEQLVIISDEYKREQLPSNVLLINNVSGDGQYPWISNCHFMVIPIDKTEICSGDTVLLTAMSLAKTIFVTSPSTLSEMYVKDGVDSVYISKDIEETRIKINGYIQDDKGGIIGQTARNTFLQKYSRYIMGRNIANYMR